MPPGGPMGANMFFAFVLSQKPPILFAKISFLLGWGGGVAVGGYTTLRGDPGETRQKMLDLSVE